MTPSEIYIKHWNANYGTNYGEGKAPHYAVAAMEEYAILKTIEIFEKPLLQFLKDIKSEGGNLDHAIRFTEETVEKLKQKINQ